jgi:hypothetical protein
MNGTFYNHFSFLLLRAFFHHKTFTHTNTGEVSSVKVKGDPIQYSIGIAIYHKDQFVFVVCDQTLMKVTSSGSLFPFKSPFSHLFFFFFFELTFIFFSFNFGIAGMSSILAENNNESGNKDGMGMNAQFNHAYDIDQKTGILFVSDIVNHRIRKITSR